MTRTDAEASPPATAGIDEHWFWDTQSKQRRSIRASWRVVRLVAFVVVLIWSAKFLADQANAVCETVIRTGFEAAKTVTCSAPGLDSPLTLGLLLLALLVLWPDLSEVAVLGVTLKRQIGIAADSAKKAEQAATSLSAQVSQWVLTSAASTSSSSNEVNIFTNADARTVTRAADQPGVAEGLGSDAAALEDVSEDALVGKIVRKWAELQESLQLDSRLRPAVDDSTPQAARVSRVRLDFVEHWYEELLALRRLRNASAHGADLERARLVDGVLLLDSLLTNYARRVGGTEML